MTAALPELAGIEHLDHEPVCERSEYGRCVHADAPRADYWVVIHGCWERFWCARCLEFMRACEKRFLCLVCWKTFAAFDHAITRVVPLR
ncbi:hypothetical protein [Nocardia puris]|uniref:hypothetical protein n=1 Tax=Nocardia puris TaxID=208602 RepID=UPI002E1B5960